MADLYEDDILLWSERQADLLRRLARGEDVRSNIDWDNVAEEVESVGRNFLRELESNLVRALRETLKAQAWPSHNDAPVWRAEAIGFRQEAAAWYSPSMRERINVDDVYERALLRIPETWYGEPPLPIPERCPYTLDELLEWDRETSADN